MIAVSTIHFDPQGTRIFRHISDQENRTGSRRVARTATLDGGCTIYDTGYTDADRTVTVRERQPSDDAINFAARMCRSAPQVRVSMEDGCYLGVPRDFQVKRGVLELNILITERLDG